MNPVRVRYAPSPTGSPHVGNIRDALFKHLLAKNTGGVHILRIEDTDRARLVPGCEDEIVASLRWLSIEWQEGFGVGGPHEPYRQSERKELGIYAKLVEQLLASGHAYPAFDTSEELTAMREYQQINKQPIGYFGGIWRDATPEQVAQARAEGRTEVIRQRIPRNTTIVIEDVIRGRIEWDSNTVDDPVLIKGDGMPTYHFAAMVDDHLMEITHIMRGEEWISSAPKHACLFDAFGWQRPAFVHCPVIKGKDGSKLSKRHGDTRVLDFRSAGYLPEALINFVALIGWSPGGDRELMNPTELAEAFSLDGLQPSPGVFDLDKLRWMNGNYIRAFSTEELFNRLVEYIRESDTLAYWSREGTDNPATAGHLSQLAAALERDPDFVRSLLPLEQERVVTLADFGEACAFFLVDEVEFVDQGREKWFGEAHVPELFTSMREKIAAAAALETADCEALVREYAAANGMEKLGPVVHPLRVALSGKTKGPGLFEMMSVLGRDRMIARFQRAEAMARSNG